MPISRARAAAPSFALLCAATPALAIPSPELIVGSLSSLSQLGALAAATLGGGAMLAGAKGGQATRRAWIAIAVLTLLTTGLLATLLIVTANHAAERQARLEANLLRPARQPGQAMADPTLKELTYREQETHPLGLTTLAASEWLAAMDRQENQVVIDARNDVEVEMGGLPAKRILRLSDFKADDPAHRGKKFLFFCHNGNRSYETCEAARAKGIDCRFMIGGLEKWVVERRPMTGTMQNRTLGQLRAIPDYPNKDRLLDTSEVKALVESKAAQFIDVRYPGEFAVQHIPGAINLPLRRLARPDVAAALEALPKKPVILPCYDRRSCFFADVMGLELTRAGHQVEGRYTVPSEYFIPSGRPPHVDAWIAEANKSLWQRARETLSAALATTAQATGLPLALLLLALVSRGLILPFALKSERDQLIVRATEHVVKNLKARLAGDPVRLRRALAAYARKHNLTPVRNLVALLFLPLLAVAVLAAGDAATSQPASFLWLPDLSVPDRTVALPLLFATLLTFYCVEAFARTRRQAAIVAAIGLPLLSITAVSLPAASALYLTMSALLLALQRLWIIDAPRRAWRALKSMRREQSERRLDGARLLDRPLAREQFGNKAARLATLSSEGYPVPAALVLDHHIVANLLAQPAKAQLRLARRMARTLGGHEFAVRSSATAEDGATASFAGVFESILHVKAADIPAAIQRVAGSFNAARVARYAVDGGHGNVIVQRMLRPRYAGVLFTRAPDAPGHALIEMIEGTADALVSGQRAPNVYRVGRLTHTPIGATPPIDILPLLVMGRRIARSAGTPQDIEWAYVDGRFYILQARDIAAELTEKPIAAAAEAVLARVMPPDGAAVAAEPTRLHTPTMAELLPRPTTLSLDLLNALWAPGGSVDLACRRLGLDYAAGEFDPPLYARVNGRLVVDTALEGDRALKLSNRKRTRLLKDAATIAADLRRDTLPRLRQHADLLSAIDLARLTRADLQRHWLACCDRFLKETHPEAEIVNILAALAAPIAGDSDATTRPAWYTALLDTAQATQRTRADAIQRIAGHRSNLDYELAHPRWSEVPGAVEAFVATLKPRAVMPPPSPGSSADLALLKEEAKHEVLRDVAILRAILLELDHRFGLGGHIFELNLDEVRALSPINQEAMQLRARERRLVLQRLLQEPPPPSRLTARDIEQSAAPRSEDHVADRTQKSHHDGRCKGRGTRVSGRQDAVGRVYVASIQQAETGVPLDGFRDGDILVTPMVHPDWLGTVLRAGGVVTDTGAWLSHMAIVAREHGIAMIVGVPNAGQFRTGDRVRLLPDGKIMAEAEAGARLALVAVPA